MLCLMELWFDCVSFGVFFKLYTKMKYKTKSMDVLTACKISESGGIWTGADLDDFLTDASTGNPK